MYTPFQRFVPLKTMLKNHYLVCMLIYLGTYIEIFADFGLSLTQR